MMLKLAGWHDDMTGVTFKATDGLLAEVIDIQYGIAAQSASGEWTVVLLFTTRQDGRTSWQVSLVEVDGRVVTESGVCGTDDVPEAVNSSIANLTRAAGWRIPLN
jgi:hypothetical protein